MNVFSESLDTDMIYGVFDEDKDELVFVSSKLDKCTLYMNTHSGNFSLEQLTVGDDASIKQSTSL